MKFTVIYCSWQTFGGVDYLRKEKIIKSIMLCVFQFNSINYCEAPKASTIINLSDF